MKKSIILLLTILLNTQIGAMHYIKSAGTTLKPYWQKAQGFGRNHPKELCVAGTILTTAIVTKIIINRRRRLQKEREKLIKEAPTQIAVTYQIFAPHFDKDSDLVLELLEKNTTVSSNYPIVSYVSNIEERLAHLERCYHVIEEIEVRKNLVKLQSKLSDLKLKIIATKRYQQEHCHYRQEQELQNLRHEIRHLRAEQSFNHPALYLPHIAQKAEPSVIIVSPPKQQVAISRPQINRNGFFKRNMVSSPKRTGSNYSECVHASQTFFGGSFGS